MKAPWHLWVVGGVTLLFNLGGAFDYTMTQTRNEKYMAQFSQVQLDFFYGFPVWVDALWAIAVWGAVLGSLVLLLRLRSAVWLFVAALVAMLGTFLHNFVLADVKMHDIAGPEAIWFAAVIVLVTFATMLYARAMARRGVL